MIWFAVNSDQICLSHGQEVISGCRLADILIFSPCFFKLKGSVTVSG
jgi:hypothetical protein